MRTNNTVRVRPSASDPDAHATHFYREPHSAIWPRMQPLRHSTRRVRRPPVCVMLSVFRRGGAKRRHHHAETVQKLSGEQTAAAGMGAWASEGARRTEATAARSFYYRFRRSDGEEVGLRARPPGPRVWGPTPGPMGSRPVAARTEATGAGGSNRRATSS